MKLDNSLATVLTAPTPAALWQLRGDLLEAGLAAGAEAWPILDHFYHFLNELRATSTSRQFSHLASLLDIGAVGGVVLQSILDVENPADLWQRLLTGGLSEGLMILAARQYVKAWDSEMASKYGAAGWFLYGHLWHLSRRLQPSLEPAARRRLVDTLLAPIHDADLNGTIKAVLIGRLFQILLLVTIRMEIGD